MNKRRLITRFRGSTAFHSIAADGKKPGRDFRLVELDPPDAGDDRTFVDIRNFTTAEIKRELKRRKVRR